MGFQLDTRFLQNLKQSFKPSMLTRILFEGGASNAAAALASESAVAMSGGAAAIQPVLFQSGINLPSRTEQFIARAMIKFFVLVISLFCALKVVERVGLVFIFPSISLDENPDSEESPNKIFKQKYKKIIVLVFLFIIVTTVIYYLFMKIPLGILAGYYVGKKLPGESVMELAKAKYDTLFNSFISRDGPGNTVFYNTMQLYALFAVFAMFVIYFLLARGFINNLRYPQHTDNEDDELATETKLLTYYMVTIMYTLLFMIGIYAAHFTYNQPITIAYFMMLITLVALFVNFTVKYILAKKNLKAFIPLLGLLILVIVNAKLLTAEASV